jgi:hypothetical protein
MELTRYVTVVAAIPIVLLLWGQQAHAQAYWNADNGFGGGGWNTNPGWNRWGGDADQGDGYGYGYHAGIVDAQNDYQSHSVYSPYPSVCCHSSYWMNNFRSGYNHEWSILQMQEQEQTQVTKQNMENNFNVENNPGATIIVRNNQQSDQGQGRDMGDGSGENGP